MRILVLTSVYKDVSLGAKDTATDIVNSFVKEWVKEGHEVIVIHNSHCYLRIVHEIPGKIKKILATKMSFAIADFDAVCEKKYDDVGAKIFRIPIKKYIPHQSPSENAINAQVNKIIKILNKENFMPDVITGHWASPQMEIIALLKRYYKCRTAVVLHGTGYVNSPRFNAARYLPYIDRIGARSLSQAREIQRILKLKEQPFVCYSGIPDSYISNYRINIEKFKNINKWKFSYVGRLVKYKNVDKIIKALSNLTEVDWELNIVGEGAMRSSLEKLAKEVHCFDKVNFMGKIPRDEVMKILSNTHCFIMISNNEIFGLVYLEAMAASCITIASKDGGVDGIIRHGENGFLCEQGNQYELSELIKKIIGTKSDIICRVVHKAYDTANQYSDSNASVNYIRNLQSD